MTFDGGTLGLAGDLTRAATLNAGGGGLDVATGASHTYSGVLSGTGGLNKTGAGTLTLSGTNTYSGGTSLNAGTLIVSSDSNLGTGALTFNGGTLGLAGDLTRAATLNAGGGTIDVATGASHTYSGVMSGTGGLTKTGDGTLTLSGTNTYSGGTSLNAGTLIVSSDSNLGTGALTFDGGALGLGGDLTLAATLNAGGGTIDVATGASHSFSGKLSGTGKLTKTGAGTLTLSGANTYSGGTDINAGTLAVGGMSALGTGPLGFNGGALQLTADVSFGGTVALGAGGGSIETNTSTNSTFSGVMSGAGSLTKTGAGSLKLSGTNSYTGGTFINDGVLKVTSDANLGAATGAVTLNGGTLETDGTFSSARKMHLTADATIHNTGGAASFSGVVDGNGALTIETLNYYTAVTLTGQNTYKGGTVVADSSLLVISSDENLGDASGDLTLYSYSTLRLADQFSTNRKIHLASDSGWVDTNGHDVIFKGAIDGTGMLAKDGEGTLTLSGNNTFSGGVGLVKGTLIVSKDENLGDKAGVIEFDGGGLQLSGSGFSSARELRLNAAAMIDTNGFNGTLSGVIHNGDDPDYKGQLTKSGAGTLTLSSVNTYTGGTVINGGVVSVGADENLGAATGALSFNGGLLQLTGSFDNSRVVTLDAGGGTIQTSLLHSNGFSGVIGGAGQLTKSGAGTLTLSGVNSYTGGTAVNGGVLSVGADANLGAATGALSFGGGTLHLTDSFDNSRAVTLGGSGGTIETTAAKSNGFSGVISGAGKLTKTGAGTLALSGVNSYTGGTAVNGGVLSVGADENLGATAGALSFNGGTLLLTDSFDSARAVTLGVGGGTIETTAAKSNDFSGVISGAGKLTKDGDGILVLSGANSYSGTTTVSKGTLQIGNGSTTGSITGTVDIASGATLTFKRSDAYTYSDVIKGAGALHQDGSGTLTLTGTNTYTGGTTISAGTLQIGNGSTTGSIAGNVDNNGTLAFNRSNTLDFSGVISGTGIVQQNGAGSLTLSGDSSAFGGSTSVASGTLLVDGSLGGTVSVASGASFGGAGTIGGNVTVAEGASLVGQAGQVLTFDKNLSLANNSTIEASFGGASQTGLFNVKGDLTLGGTINVGTFGDDGPGIYTVFDYSGNLTDNTLSVGTLPSGQDAAKVSVQTNQSGKVNILNTNGGELTFWDGDDAANQGDGVPNGGDGTWTNEASNKSWTDHNYLLNGPWDDSGFAIFTGAKGTVTIDNSAGAVKASGMQFQTDGYEVTGGDLTLVSPASNLSGAPIIRVGGGTNDGDMKATISAKLVGTDGMRKTYAGRLVLTADNQYTGGTDILGGTLQLGDGGTSGSVLGDIDTGIDGINRGLLAVDRSGTVTVDNTITGTGVVSITGSGEITLSGNNSYSGGTYVRSGTLVIAQDDNLGLAESVVAVGADPEDVAGGATGNAVLKFGADFTGANTFTHTIELNTAQSQLDTNGHTVIASGVILGSDGLTKTGDGTLILTYNNDYDGGTTISNGTLQIGNGGTSGTIEGDVTNNGILAFNRSDAYAFDDKISGTGSVEQIGTDTLTLTGANDYTGGTSVKSGTLAVASNGVLGALSGALTLDGGTFENTAAFSTKSRAIAIGAGGGTFQTDADLTLEGALTGTGTWTKTGTGDLIFGGDESAFAGTGTVQTGTVRVDGTLGGDLAVQTGATLRGTGTIDGNTTIDSGATLVGLDNNTLTMNGNLTLANGSMTNIALGTPTGSALFDVKGDLTLGGTLNVTEDVGGFGAGVYRIFDYGGTLTDNGMTIGTVPQNSDASGMWIQTDYEHQVNLVNQNGVEVTFWNAEGDRSQNNQNSKIVGGSGTWDVRNDNWTEDDKGSQQGQLFNGRWDNGSFAVFGGNAGTVTINNQNGTVTASGLNFATDGYVLTGDALMLDNGAPGTAPIIRVGDGKADSNITATISAELQGTGGLRKTDYGTLVLTGANSYSGGTTVTGGVLQIGDGGNTGSIKGDVAVSSGAYGDGTLAFNRSDDTEFDGNITGDGKGGVVQKGTGTTTFTGDNTFSGGLTVENGGVKAGVAGHAFGTGTLKVKAGATADLGGFDTTVGGLAAFDASGTTGDGDIALGSGKLTVEQSFDSKFSGVISGTGDLTKSGTGTLTLNTAGTYTGATNVDGGTLKQGAAGVFNNASSGYTVGTDGTLDLGGFDTTLAALSNGGLITMGTQQTAGTTLSVTGNYTGTGGTVVINTVLGDDSSKTDRLKVGGDTSGTTNLKVNNRGGLGAQTVNGIEVVEVAGQSNGTFSLVSDYTTKDGQKAVVGGAYAYTLQQGAGSGNKDGNWYLTSQTTQEPPAPDCQQTNTCPVDPDNPRYSAGVPVYQGYAQNMQVLNKLPTLQERVGNRYLTSGNDNDASNTDSSTVDSRGIWARIEGAHNRLEPHSATGMKQDINSFIMQTGVDGQFYEDANGKLIAGITGQYGTAHGNSSSFFGDGYTDTSAWSLGATATWYGNDGFYVDTQGQLTWFDNDLNSDTANSGLADGAKAFGYALSAEVGQRIALDEHWSLTPQAQLMWSSLDADAFHDIWGNRVHMQDGDSLTARFGLAANYQDSWQGDDGRMVNTSVYGIANVYQEFLGGTRINVAGVNVDTDNDKTWAGIGAGGTYAWADSKYAIYGQGSINTSLNHLTDSYAVKGNIGFTIRW
ncbi:autotransporter-associated beta strand repeat-containing protein [Brucella anthropi]|uniref:autotransporter-associated beta strand repeat-containing protein n=1 Tax=Brucella anthropi TaxID=529 RepID=UPI001F236621|nr:autotransporter-associated beta strand repeat-containing protein [Brucella anthropi]